ncbi:hypothetical protein [Thiocystis violacea]|uniref:hypothetical protein n=1 Tax=Thiocystis violacea TaxID=13725 RepID=UPI0019083F6A|nr:hypothetical protein [Thiocystis violacea]MBK1717351.1 hypothetical protein [Thiocystis violacea]
MRHSTDHAGRQREADRRLAIAAAALYLANLLILPGIAFAILLLLAWRHRANPSALAAAHLRQAVAASLWIGGLLLPPIAAALALAPADASGMGAWMLVILFFILCHTSFVLLGVIALTRAMAGLCWRYPLIGPALPAACGRGPRHD